MSRLDDMSDDELNNLEASERLVLTNEAITERMNKWQGDTPEDTIARAILESYRVIVTFGASDMGEESYAEANPMVGKLLVSFLKGSASVIHALDEVADFRDRKKD